VTDARLSVPHFPNSRIGNLARHNARFIRHDLFVVIRSTFGLVLVKITRFHRVTYQFSVPISISSDDNVSFTVFGKKFFI